MLLHLRTRCFETPPECSTREIESPVQNSLGKAETAKRGLWMDMRSGGRMRVVT
jgi:hypothetical protein